MRGATRGEGWIKQGGSVWTGRGGDFSPSHSFLSLTPSHTLPRAIFLTHIPQPYSFLTLCPDGVLPHTHASVSLLHVHTLPRSSSHSFLSLTPAHTHCPGEVLPHTHSSVSLAHTHSLNSILSHTHISASLPPHTFALCSRWRL